MDVRSMSVLSEAFVQDVPQCPQTIRGGQVAPEWESWQRSLSTWLSQAQSVVDVNERIVANRIGATVTLTGKVLKGERIEGIYPAKSFNVGDVVFDESGFIRNDGNADISLSVSFVTRR